LGNGCFVEVWRGHIAQTSNKVAIKFEDLQNPAFQLQHEAEILKTLNKDGSHQGIVQIFHYGTEGRYRCMVMELLGYSIEDRVAGCKGRLTVASTVLIADQVLRRIEFLHSKGIVHRDIKPENFMFGLGDKIHHLYLIDFGLSKKYWEGTRHVQPRTKLSLTGTARYASINAHKGNEQSRRDDLEAIGHMFMYFLRGSLPWSGLEAKTQEDKYRKIKEKKDAVPLTELCQGYPSAFKEYLVYARGLAFKDRPDYQRLRKLFQDVRDNELEGEKLEDHGFQWFAGQDLGTLVPLERIENTKQPDDNQPSRKAGFDLSRFFPFCCKGKTVTE